MPRLTRLHWPVYGFMNDYGRFSCTTYANATFNKGQLRFSELFGTPPKRARASVQWDPRANTTQETSSGSCHGRLTYMCVYIICICIRVYIYIHIHIYIYMYIHIHVCTHICVYIYMYICMYTYRYTLGPIQPKKPRPAAAMDRLPVQVMQYWYYNSITYLHTYIHIYIYIYTYKYDPIAYTLYHQLHINLYII